jgi:hypothetical protein
MVELVESVIKDAKEMGAMGGNGSGAMLLD